VTSKSLTQTELKEIVLKDLNDQALSLDREHLRADGLEDWSKELSILDASLTDQSLEKKAQGGPDYDIWLVNYSPLMNKVKDRLKEVASLKEARDKKTLTDTIEDIAQSLRTLSKRGSL